MRIRPIGGAWTTVKTPTKLSIDIEDLGQYERAADGTMFSQRIATKRKLNCEWAYMTPAQLSTILTVVVDNVNVQIEYVDPKTNATETRTFYTGGKTQDVLRYDESGNAVGYVDITFNAIEV